MVRRAATISGPGVDLAGLQGRRRGSAGWNPADRIGAMWLPWVPEWMLDDMAWVRG